MQITSTGMFTVTQIVRPIGTDVWSTVMRDGMQDSPECDGDALSTSLGEKRLAQTYASYIPFMMHGT